MRLRWMKSDFVNIVGVLVLTQVISLISGPLVAHMLGASERGSMAMIMVVATMFAQLGTASLTTAVSRTVAGAGSSAMTVVGPYLRTWFLLSTLPSLGAAGMVLVVLNHDARIWAIAAVTFLITVLACWMKILNGMLQGEGAVAQINTQRIVFGLGYLACVLAVWMVDHVTVAVVICGAYVCAQLVVLVMSWRALRPAAPEGSPGDLGEIRRFARRTLVVSVNVVEGLGLDQLLVGVLMTTTALGLYAVAISLTTLPAMVLAGIAATLLPRITAQPPELRDAVIRRWVLASLAVNVAIVIGLELIISPAIHLLFGDEFVPAIACARILIIARAVLAMRLVLTAVAQAQGRALSTSVIEIATAVVLVIGVVVGITLGGITGAAAGLLASGVFACLVLIALITRPSEALQPA